MALQLAKESAVLRAPAAGTNRRGRIDGAAVRKQVQARRHTLKRAVRILLQPPPQRHGARGHLVGERVLDQVGALARARELPSTRRGLTLVRLNIVRKGRAGGAATS